MTKAMWETATAPCPMRPFGAAQAGKRGSFIFPCPNLFCFGILLREGFPRCKDSKNPLAVELERENDPGREMFFRRILLNFFSVEATTASTARIYSNVQHVEAYGSALGIDG